MKKLLFIFVPIIYGLLIYTISPNSFFSNTKDIDGGSKYIQSLLNKNEKDPLNIAFENLLSKVPSLENNFKDMLVYHHHLWIKNNCDPKCSKETIKEKIEFYNKQPIQHSLFESVIFQFDILIPYTNKALKNCLENYCNNIVGKHEINFELTFSKKNPELAKKINEIILKNREPLFTYTVSLEFDGEADSEEEQNIEVFFNKIVTINQLSASYGHGAAHWNGGEYTTHFNIPENRLLQFHDVFKKNIIPKLSKLVFNKIKEGSTKPPNLLHPIEETVSKINLWNFTKKGIYLYLPPYEEGGRMSTSRDFSYEEMNEFLTPFGKSLR